MIATCEFVPQLDPDDRMLVDELRGRGLTVAVAVWNDPHRRLASARLCVVRSTWDYHRRYDDFIGWIDRVSAQTAVKTIPICSLERAQVVPAGPRTPRRPDRPDALGARGDPRTCARSHATRLALVVLKPARGAAAHGVTLVRRRDASLTPGKRISTRLLADEDVLVQPYLASVVDYGERALIFLRALLACRGEEALRPVLAVARPVVVVEATNEEVSVALQAVAACRASRSTRASTCSKTTPARTCERGRAHRADALLRATRARSARARRRDRTRVGTRSP